MHREDMRHEVMRPSASDTTAQASTPGSTAEGFDERDLWAALGKAIQAPSIHNSQPWRWRLGSGAVISTRTRPDGRRSPIRRVGTW